MSYDYLAFIGRFQPCTVAHIEVMGKALSLSENLIVLIGSTNSARCPRNPFTYAERVKMIRNSLVALYSEGTVERRVRFVPLEDYPYIDQKWEAQVQRKVLEIASEHPHNPQIGLIGHSKDNSSYYLKKFPMWSAVDVDAVGGISATDVRNDYFDVDNTMYSVYNDSRITEQTARFLEKFNNSNGFCYVAEWIKYDQFYRETIQVGPYPTQILCADAVVVQSGHILLIERAGMPGRGLLALPGGHVNPDETFRSAAVRELKEETRIADGYGEMPPGKLESFIKGSFVADNPNRSSRARVMSMAFLFRLPEAKTLYKVRGDDDAASAKWYKLGELDASMMFEDHFSILDSMLGGL